MDHTKNTDSAYPLPSDRKVDGIYLPNGYGYEKDHFVINPSYHVSTINPKMTNLGLH